MKTYKYQMHTHTAPCSRCATMSARELARALSENGYAGAVLTNHFFGGNTGIDRALEWREFVRAYEEDYAACKEAAQEYGIDIVFSIEEHLYDGKEVFLYGITPDILAANPNLRGRRPQDYRALADEYGFLIIQSHPYRVRNYITNPGPLDIELLDGIEVYNAANKPDENDLARQFAESNPSLILTSGADAHAPECVCICGIESYERLKDEATLVKVLKSGNYKILTR